MLISLFSHCSLPALKLSQKSNIIFIQQPHIIDFVFQQCDTFETYAECEAGVFFGVNAAHFEDMWVYHSASEDFDPTGAFAETASFAAAFEAGNVYFGAWFGEWEVVRAELSLGFGSEKFFCEYFQCPFQVSEGNVLINDKSFDLMEGW